MMPYLNMHGSIHPLRMKCLLRLTGRPHLRTVYPNMLSGHLQGKFLEMISHLLAPRRILEIGTFTGYSAICMARGLAEGGLLHTIDINDETMVIARKYIHLAALEDKIILHTGNALDIISESQRDLRPCIYRCR